MSLQQETAIKVEQTIAMDQTEEGTKYTIEAKHDGMDAVWMKLQELEDRIEKMSASKSDIGEKNEAKEKEKKTEDNQEEEEQEVKLSFGETILHYAGKCILLILLFTHKVHTIIGTLIFRRLRKGNPLSITKWYWIPIVFPIVFYFAFPLIIHSILLFVLTIYDEIQSWMIAHIVWGFCVSMYWLFFLLNIKSAKYNTVNAVLWKLIGIDLPEEQQKSKGYISVLLASLIPAITAGFIANFILEEKFILECDVNTKGSLCADNGEECCTIISSHDISNMYVFVGQLISNALGMFAVIRITAWLMTKGDPTLMKVSQRRK